MDNIALEKLKLNQQDQFGNTALHLACIKVRTLYKFVSAWHSNREYAQLRHPINGDEFF